jgi:hypothetical protein
VELKLNKCLTTYDKVLDWSIKNLEKICASTGDTGFAVDRKFSSDINERENLLNEYFSRIKE